MTSTSPCPTSCAAWRRTPRRRTSSTPSSPRARSRWQARKRPSARPLPSAGIPSQDRAAPRTASRIPGVRHRIQVASGTNLIRTRQLPRTALGPSVRLQMTLVSTASKRSPTRLLLKATSPAPRSWAPNGASAPPQNAPQPWTPSRTSWPPSAGTSSPWQLTRPIRRSPRLTRRSQRPLTSAPTTGSRLASWKRHTPSSTRTPSPW